MSQPAATSYDVPAAGLLLLVRRVESVLQGRLHPHLVEAGLTQEHWRIMSFLLQHPGARMSAIADAAVLPSASLTRHMDRLVELGIVLRRIDAHDRRSSVVALSPDGSRLAESLRAVELAVEGELEQLLGRDTLEALRRALAVVPVALG